MNISQLPLPKFYFNPRKANRVIVAMSGGVDSSVTAALLVELGFDVTGVTFKLWNPIDDILERDESCCSLDDINSARDICDQLGIPYYVFNFKQYFHDTVVENFVSEYKLGRTPNPCVVCNKKVKFEHFFNKAMSMGFDYVATGHYARIDCSDDIFYLKPACYTKKDQSYFLYNIPYSHLKRTLFPLGTLEKPQVRQLAEHFGFNSVAQKKDSQEICFIDSNGYVTFLESYTFSPSPKGFFVDKFGKILGPHKGFWNYTIGQRKNLGMSFNKPMYVTNLDPTNYSITLSSDPNDLMSKSFIVSEINWVTPTPPNLPIQLYTKIRNQAPLAACNIDFIFSNDKHSVKVDFCSPQRAITKGQSAVFYENNNVIGGGIIQ